MQQARKEGDMNWIWVMYVYYRVQNTAFNTECAQPIVTLEGIHLASFIY